MKHPVVRLLISWTVLAFGVALAAAIVPGIGYADARSLFWVVVLLSFFNAILRPVLLLFTFPFIILTLGIGIVVINALLFYWAGSLVKGFHVDSFFAALGGSLIVSLTNMILHSMLKKADKKPATPGTPPTKRAKPDDVIDI